MNQSSNPTQLTPVELALHNSQFVTPEPIAIIGIGCRFPGGANSPQAFWQLLCDGVDAISEIPANRWSLANFYDPDRNKSSHTYVRWGGFLDELDGFDAQFFGISPREAASMDPQQRWLLEVTWEALEDAGLPAQRLNGSNTGVFVGLFIRDYEQLQMSSLNRQVINSHTSVGVATSIAANRISYVFDWVGPSIAVDTACSSSMVALHYACQSLRNGECTLAVAGGVNAILKAETTIAASRSSMLSPDGRSKSFDASANGYVRSEGAAMVVLKPLSQALADGNPIYAVIRGSAINQDGRSGGLTVPNGASQEAALRAALRQAGVDPRTIQYAEAHGTGTPVGDPIESKALGNVLGSCRLQGDPLLIGSVKSNIGHTESAAGVAGLIKTALALKHGQIPANLHFHTPNPQIPFAALNLQVVQTQQSWPAPQNGAPRRAAINSFGFGGSNASVIVEERPETRDQRPETRRQKVEDRRQSLESPVTCHLPLATLLRLSARSPEALRALAQSYLTFFQTTEASLADICYSASLHRDHHAQRLALVAQQKGEMVEQLDAFLAGEARLTVVAGQASETAPQPVFVCAGMGPQSWGMGRQLLKSEPVFYEAIAACDQLFQPLAGWSLLAELNVEESAARMNETQVAQPTNFALQVGLAALLHSWGVEPAAVVGHSAGEIAAAYMAGALSLEDAVQVIYHRSRLQQTTAGTGTMLAVGLSQEAVETLIEPYADRVSIGAINSPGALTLAGETAALKKIAALLTQRQQFNRFLQVEVPYHSPQMEPIKTALLEALQGIRPQPTRLPLYSPVTGQLIEGESLDAAYWWKNVRNPVRFGDAVTAMVQSSHTLFVELSPQPVLVRAVQECLNHARQDNTKEDAAGSSGMVLSTLRRDQPERASLLATAGALYTQGLPLNWPALTAGRFVQLPSYPWQHERYWLESEESQQYRVGQERFDGSAPLRRSTRLSQGEIVHPLLGSQLNLAPAVQVWEAEIDRRQLSYLNDHAIQNAIVYPGAAYVEMALTAASLSAPGAHYRVETLSFHKPLVLGNEPARLQLTLKEDGFTIYSARGTGEATWVQHATGKLQQVTATETLLPAVELEALRTRLPHRLAQANCYAQFQTLGLHYGPAFQGIQELWCGRGEAVGRLQGTIDGRDLAAYHLHPSLLDACFQTLIGTLLAGEMNGVYLPVAIEHIQVNAPKSSQLQQSFQQELWCHAQLAAQTEQEVVGNLQLYDVYGKCLLTLQGLRCHRQAQARPAQPTDAYLYHYQWQPLPPLAPDLGQAAADFLPPPAVLVEPLQARLSRTKMVRSGLPNPDHVRGCDNPLRANLDLPNLQHPAQAEQAQAEMDALCRAYIIQTLNQLGWKPQPGEHPDAATLTQQLGIVAQHEQYFTRLLTIVENQQGGAASQESLNLSISQSHPTAADLRERYPAYAAELALIQQCGDNLAGVLRGQIEPTALIFANGSFAAIEQLYQNGASFQSYNHRVQQTVAAALAHLPVDRPLRILEIGGGTGAMSAAIIQQLPAERTRYLFTDVVEVFLQRAKQKFQSYPFVEYQTLDIERDPLVQGFTGHAFDLILGLDVLRATRDLRQSLANVQQLLAPNGLLLLQEITACPVWFDLVFGMLRGWWRFSDHDLRSTHPTLPLASWQGLLHETGFPAAAALADDSTYSLLLAQTAAAAPISMPLPELAPGEPATWLIFADKQGVGAHLAERLLAVKQVPVLVTPGATYQQLGAHHFQIRPTTSDDFRRLLTSDLLALPPCKQVVHLWSLDMPAAQPLDQTLGVFSVLPLVQTLAGQSPHLCLVTRGAQAVQPGAHPENIQVQQTPLWGLGRVIAQEQPELRCTRLDLPPTAHLATDATNLFYELWTSSPEDQVAWRHGVRHGLRLERYLPTGAGQQPAVRNDGAYLITGGLGGLGLAIAQGLVAQGARHLVLTGRNGARGKEAEIRQLEAAGATVRVIAADVGQANEVARLLQEIATHLPPLRGIVHAAGVLDDGVLGEQSPARFEKVMSPKMYGAWHLHQQTQSLPLDFFVNFSSLASLIGNGGQGNYAAANAFLDGLAHQRRAQGLPALSINWGAWSQVGMAAQDGLLDRLVELGLEAITPEEGVAAFVGLLGQPVAQVGVAAFTWAKFMARSGWAHSPLFAAFAQESASPQATSSVLQELQATAPTEQSAFLHRYLRTQLAGVLGFSSPDQIKPRQGLFDLGMDSLMSVELRNRLQANLGVTLASTLLFDYPTVEALSNHLVKQLVSAPIQAASPPALAPVDETAALRARLDGLSQEDLAALLAQELASR